MKLEEQKFNIFTQFYQTSQSSFPSGWSNTPIKGLEYLEIDNGVVYTQKEHIALQSNRGFTVSSSNGKDYYFEVTIRKLENEGVVAIGLAGAGFPSTGKLPGWDKGTYGYHSDDGNLFAEDGKGKAFGKTFHQGTVVGCGVTNDRTLYFTINGEKCPDTKVKIPDGVWYPTVGLEKNLEIDTNFGGSFFTYSQLHPQKQLLKQQKLSQSLTKDRYLTFIQSDKPIYRPGDTIYFRGWVLHSLSFAPLSDSQSLSLFGSSSAIKVQILSSSDSEMYHAFFDRPQNSTIAGSWEIPQGTSGGDYRIRVEYFGLEGFPTADRKFNIRSFSNPRMKLQLEFPRKGYGPGDEVAANLDVKRAEGSVPDGATVTAAARVDGVEVFTQKYTLSSSGKLEIKFQLPKDIQKGEGSLNCTVDDSGTIETTGGTIPILLQSIDMKFYPEGGYVVADLPNRVYVEAFTPTGDPADFSAEIFDETDKKVVGNFSTLHEGRGRACYTPQRKHSYCVKVIVPSGIRFTNALPQVQDSGVVIAAARDYFESKDVMSFQIGASYAGTYIVSLYKREKLLLSRAVETVRMDDVISCDFTLSDAADAYGVLRATVFDSKNTPVAERLVFRKREEKLVLKIKTDKSSYSPGSKVRVQVQAVDEKGFPTESIMGLCVTDDTVLEMVEKRKQVPRLPVMVQLENEVDHLDDAQIYMDSSNPKSGIALDLLLGTQGWRRFVYKNLVDFLKESEKEGEKTGPAAKSKDLAERLVAMHKSTVKPSDALNDAPPPPPLGGLLEEDDEMELGGGGGRLLMRRGSPEPKQKKGFAFGAMFKKKDAEPAPRMAEKKEKMEERKAMPVNKPVAMAPPRAQADAAPMAPKAQPMLAKSLSASRASIAPPAKLAAPAPMMAKLAAPMREEAEKKKKMAPMKDKMEKEEAPRARRMVAPSIAPSSSIPVTLGTVVTIREFAHKNKPERTSNSREDFTETLYWNAGITTSVSSGSKPIKFSSTSNIPVENGSILKPNLNGWRSVKSQLPFTSNASFAVKIKTKSSSCYVMIGIVNGNLFNEYSHIGTVGDGACYYGQGSSYMNGSNVHSGTYVGNNDVVGVNFDIGTKTVKFTKNGAPMMTYILTGNGPYFPAISTYTYGDEFEVMSGSTGSSGSGTFSFDLNDSVTSFKVWAEAVTKDGNLVSQSHVFASLNPFYAEYKLPIEVSSGDQIGIPVSLVNSTENDISVSFNKKSNDDGKWLEFPDEEKGKLKIPAISVPQNSRSRTTITARAAKKLENGAYVSLTLEALAGSLSDAVTRKTLVLPVGFPYEANAAGVLSTSAKSGIHSFSLPQIFDPETAKTSVKIFVSPVGNLTSAMQRLIREPGGCFEQTSSTQYPMVMAQQYFMSHTGVDPALVSKAKEHIASGYKRLVGYEVKNGGKNSGAFDWFGSPPGHESLTAYGLLEFDDISKVHPIDQDLIPRVRNWLLSRKGSDGKFQRNSRALDSFGRAPAEITDAYICWALSETGEKPEMLKNEIKNLMDLGDKDKKYDPYFLSLIALTLFNLGLKDEAHKYAYFLTEMQAENGSVVGKNNVQLHDTRFTSITNSWGNALAISCTSLAAFAWMRMGFEFRDFYEKAMFYVKSSCKDGAFGDTQSTILSLKSIVQHDKLSTASGKGKIDLVLNGKKLSSKTFQDVNSEGVLVLDEFGKHLTSGEQKLEVILDGDASNVSYSVSVEYRSNKPDTDPSCPIKLTTKLGNVNMTEGEGNEIAVSLKNTDEKNGQPMTIAIIGLPGGLEPRYEQLRELVTSGKIDFYEVMGRDVCLYWTELKAGQQVDLRIDVIARIPGSYTGPASRAYLYYTNESKYWIEPLNVNIKPAY